MKAVERKDVILDELEGFLIGVSNRPFVFVELLHWVIDVRHDPQRTSAGSH